MKIYPSNHKIKTITDSYIDTDLNIPLSYINVDYSKYEINKTIGPKFNVETKTPIIINDTFDDLSMKIFNNYEEEVDTSNLLINKDGTYVYYPNNLINFTPKYFLWKATVKKSLEYKISNIYNLNIKFYDNSIDDILSSIFINPSDRFLLPPNIKINKNKMSTDTFSNITTKNSDFIFIKNGHGAYYDIDCTQKINFNDYLSTNTNMWIATEDSRSINDEYKILSSSDKIEYSLKSPIISSDSKIHCNTYFDLTNITKKAGITIHNIFNNNYTVPILILEYENSGFVIVSHSSVLNNIQDNYALIFEVLMYIYLNSYLSTDPIREWITYEVPNYEVVNNVLQSKNNFISKTDLSSYFGISSSNINLVKVDIFDDDSYTYAVSDNDLNNTTSAIKCIGKINNKLVFELDKEIDIDGYVEPEKPVGWKSVYYNGLIYYLNDIHYLIKNDLTNKTFLIENEDNLLVKIYPFKNSLLGINLSKDNNFTIPFIKTTVDNISRIKESNYTVYIKNNLIDYCYSEDYDNTIDNQYELFTITIKQTKEAIELHDIRQLGGGLPEDEDDNFNLFDIGNINGRPYRSTGTLVITMPTKYEKYKNTILEVLQKYMVGEDYPILYFEDNEEE